MLNDDRMISADLQVEQQLYQAGIEVVCGVDEVGRGALAGPVYACAIVFNSGFFVQGVNDSKCLSAKTRADLSKKLSAGALAWQLGIATSAEIDLLNIRQATFLAMRRALSGLRIKPDFVLIDGESLLKCMVQSKGIIKGDRQSFTIAAASIVAKHHRDLHMIKLDRIYPHYKFARHKGYGTREHIDMIRKYKFCPEHRRSFLKKKKKNSVIISTII